MQQSSAAQIIDDIHAVRRAQDREFARLGGTPPNLDQMRLMADAAARFRELYSDLEMTVPEPGPTDKPIHYTVKLLRPLQRFSPDWRSVDLGEIVRQGDQRSLSGIDRCIVADALRVATDKTVGSIRNRGALRAIHRVDQGGGTTISYHGSPLAWMGAFMSPLTTQVEGFGVSRR